MKKTLLTVMILTLIWIGGCKKDDPCHIPVVSAGDDVVLVDQTSVTLKGTTSEKEGIWTILQGSGGKITDNVQFTGELKTKYTLNFESKSECGSASDQMDLTLNPPCGANQSVDKMVSNMHWIQQSCFRIEGSSLTVYTDPNSITKKDTADIVLITHAHGDHYTTEDLDKIVGPKTIIVAPQDVTYNTTLGQRITLQPGGEYTAFGCVKIKAVPAYNITKSYHPKGNNWVGYLITLDGVTIYHAGDTERIPEMQTFTCDIAMLPLGQTYTFNSVSDAAEAAKDVKAKVVIPMHFGYAEGTHDDAVTIQNLLNGIIPVVIKDKGQ